MTESIVARVPISAEIARALNPHRPPERHCPECGERPPAGMVRCPGCRGGEVQKVKGNSHGPAMDSARY